GSEPPQGCPPDQEAPRQVRRDGRVRRILMPDTIEVRFKGNRRAFHSWHDDNDPLTRDTPVVVAVERGLDFGYVNSTGETAASKCGGCDGCGPATSDAAPAPLPRIVR